MKKGELVRICEKHFVVIDSGEIFVSLFNIETKETEHHKKEGLYFSRVEYPEIEEEEKDQTFRNLQIGDFYYLLDEDRRKTGSLRMKVSEKFYWTSYVSQISENFHPDQEILKIKAKIK